MFAVAQPVVLEGHSLVVGEQPEVPPAGGGDPGYLLVLPAQVAFVPDGGGEGVRVADQDRGADPGRGVLEFGLAAGDQREVVAVEAHVRPFGTGPFGAQRGELPPAELPAVLGHCGRARPHPAACPVVRGERVGEGGGAGGLRAEDDHAPGEGGPYGRLQEVPAADRVAAHGRAGDREDRAGRVDADRVGAEPAGQFVAVRLGGEDGVDAPGDGRAEHRHVRVPDRRVGDVDGDVVDGADHPDVRVHLAHPRHPRVQRDRLHGRGADEDGQPVAAVAGGPYEVVVARVRRVELAEDQPVPVALHVVASAVVSCLAPPSGACCGRCAARSRDQWRSPRTQSVMKPMYSSAVR
jgi:hypothetical protein